MKNGVNIFSRRSIGIPGPLSLTATWHIESMTLTATQVAADHINSDPYQPRRVGPNTTPSTSAIASARNQARPQTARARPVLV